MALENPGKRLDARASKRLRQAGEAFAEKLGERATGIIHDGLILHLDVRDCAFDSLTLKYSLANRFLSRNYDLVIESTMALDGENDSLITLEYGGTFRAEYAYFRQRAGGRQGLAITNRLNHFEITRRCLRIAFPRLEVRYSQRLGLWTITAMSLVGSSTWMLIPPVFHTIRLQPEDCGAIIELLELVAYAIGHEVGSRPVSH